MSPTAPGEGDADSSDPRIPPRPPLPGRASPAPRASRRLAGGRTARILLALYALVVGLIVVWPVSIDVPLGALLQNIGTAFPWLTPPRMEFAGNILIFVPLGVLLALILEHRHLVVPIAIVISVAAEATQALVLSERTPSVLDIVANLTGACIGMLVVAVIEWWRGSRAEGSRRMG